MQVNPHMRLFTNLDKHGTTMTISEQDSSIKKVTNEDIFNFEELYRLSGKPYPIPTIPREHEQTVSTQAKNIIQPNVDSGDNKNKPTKNLTFWQKLKNVFNLLFKKEPILHLPGDTTIQLQQNSIKIEGDLHLNASGSIYLFADKHIVLQSGRTEEPNRPGYLYSIWMNSDLDQNMNPLKKE